jgi:hypothetical protein
MTPYVSKIVSSFGQPLPASVNHGRDPNPSLPQPHPPPVPEPLKLSHSIRDQFIKGSGSIDLMNLPGTVKRVGQSVALTTNGCRRRRVCRDAGRWGELFQRSTAEGAIGSAHPGDPRLRRQGGKAGGDGVDAVGERVHSLTTVNGNRSAHADGSSRHPRLRCRADPAGPCRLDRCRDACRAGVLQTGGLFNVGGYQIIFNTNGRQSPRPLARRDWG